MPLDEPALDRAQKPAGIAVAQQQAMNVEALEHQSRVRGVSSPRRARQQQRFEISCQHQPATGQDALQPLQPQGRHRHRTDPLQEVSIPGQTEADGFASLDVFRWRGDPGKSGNLDLTAASLQHPDASVNGRIRKIVNEDRDLQETAHLKNAMRCGSPHLRCEELAKNRVDAASVRSF